MTSSVNNVQAPSSGPDPPRCAAILDRIRYCVETISLAFGEWDDPTAHGPGLYVVIARDEVSVFAEPMGANRWPVEDCASVFDPIDRLFESARTVAYSCDGAVVINRDGTITEQMARMKNLSTAEADRIEDLPFAGWMGARHMSALETSTRPAVFAVVTLSEEDGRMTVFTGGTYRDFPRTGMWDEYKEE